ncbi:hypothetical protein PO546_22140, partial [Escherichia coli]
ADRNRSHWSTSKTPSYTKSVSWQHHLESSSLQGGDYQAMIKSANQGVWTSVDVLLQSPTPKQADTVSFRHGWQTA